MESCYVTKRFSASELHYFVGRAIILEIWQFKPPYLFYLTILYMLYIKEMNVSVHTTVSSLYSRLCRLLNTRLCRHGHSFNLFTHNELSHVSILNIFFKCRIFFLCFFDPILVHGLLLRASRSYSDTPHSVGLLWTSDQPDAETST